jgi:hypothetical protein
VVFTAGEWFYQEFRPGLGIKSIGVPAQPGSSNQEAASD